MKSAHDLSWPDLVWSHFTRPRFGAFNDRVAAAAAAGFAGIGLIALENERLGSAELHRADEVKLARLTPREQEVLDHAVNGLHAKEIAAALGISPRTVEVHKMRIMEKLEVRNIAELVRLRFR